VGSIVPSFGNGLVGADHQVYLTLAKIDLNIVLLIEWLAEAICLYLVVKLDAH
jgi:hypothetical protein